MNSTDMEVIYERLTAIFQDVFDDDTIVARPELTADDVADWDSLAHIRLMTTIERSFGVTFSAAQVGSLEKVSDLADLLKVKALQE